MDMIYNGVWLTMGSISEFVQEPVYDDSQTDWLFDRYTIVCTAVVNGQAEVRSAGPPVSYKRENTAETANVSWTATGTPPGTVERFSRDSVNLDRHPIGVVTTPSTPPSRGIYARQAKDLVLFDIVPVANPVPLTYKAIRTRLMMPRSPLFVFSGTGVASEMFFRAPLAPEHHCDAMNGPKPMFCKQVYSAGEADTHVIQYGIQAFVNEATDTVKNRSGNPLLNNRFRMKHSATEDGVTYIEVTGEAHFRTDLEYATPTSPDDLRTRLFLPVPRGYVREQLEVEGMEAANGVKYRFVDRQQAVNFPAGPFAKASRIEALHTQTIFTDCDLLKGTSELVERTSSSILNNRFLANQFTKKVPGWSGKPIATPVTP